MTGSRRTSADLDPRRRKILFRAWHRGIREMDLLMGQFADAEIGTLTESELDDFEALSNEDIRGFLEKMPPMPRKDFAAMFPHADADAIELLNRMLQFDPRRRCSVEEALAHPWLAQLHEEAAEPSAPGARPPCMKHACGAEWPGGAGRAARRAHLSPC